ncbi:hypothetical protein HanRHA438_Chr02g0067151 [Helianthus annuus]|nr:hypothetical protein HanRHA438_Chr02g0067151 [Helianthus annuus]
MQLGAELQISVSSEIPKQPFQAESQLVVWSEISTNNLERNLSVFSSGTSIFERNQQTFRAKSEKSLEWNL